jgi:DNA-binding NtrC family response regulator
MSNPLALIVEDRPEIARMWRGNLDRLEINSIHVTNLTNAFHELDKIPPPDMVLLDLNLNIEEDANYTVTQIKEMKKRNPDLIVIIISGVLTPELTELAIRQGADGIREKLELRRQEDFWAAIKESLGKAPTKAKHAFTHPLEILEALSKKLHLL